jgi:uncharacterized protein YndB with AHSA1/START domain
MKEQSIIHNTFVIERSYPVTPKQVFEAFSDPGKKRRWYSESANHDIEQFEMDFRTGGREYASYRFKEGSPFPGVVLSNDGLYLAIEPDRCVVVGSSMTLGGRCISTSLATFELLPAGKGTDLIFTHQAAFFEGSGGPEMRERGWRKLLEQLEAELAH